MFKFESYILEDKKQADNIASPLSVGEAGRRPDEGEQQKLT